jgi:hypothetical protein
MQQIHLDVNIENDIVYTMYSKFKCKIVQVTDSFLIFIYKGIKQGYPLRDIRCFRYAEDLKSVSGDAKLDVYQDNLVTDVTRSVKGATNDR